jgi:hypothetical protein
MGLWHKMAMTLVSTKTITGAGISTLEYTGIPQTGKDLLMVMAFRTASGSVVFNRVTLKPNSANYSVTSKRLSSNGTTVSSAQPTDRIFGLANGNTSTSKTFSNVQVYFPSYATTLNKSYFIDGVTENNATDAQTELYNVEMTSFTDPITTFEIILSTFAVESTVSLYIIS